MNRIRIGMLCMLLIAFAGVRGQALDWAFATNGNGSTISVVMEAYPSGGACVLGRFVDSLDIDPGPGVQMVHAGQVWGMYVQRVDASGQLLWGGVIGGTGSIGSLGIDHSLHVGPGGEITLIGNFTGTVDVDLGPGIMNISTNCASAGFAVQYDVTGNVSWVKVLQPVSSGNIAYLNGIDGDVAGNLSLVGYYSGTMDLDPGPGSNMVSSNGMTDAYVLRLDAGGNYLSGWSVGGTKTDVALSVAVYGNGDVVVNGNYSTLVDFDPGPGTANLTTATNFENSYLARYSASGGFQWAVRMASPWYSFGGGVVVDASGNCYSYGGCRDSVDLDPGPGVDWAVVPGPSGTQNTYCVSLDGSGGYRWGMLLASSLGTSATSIRLSPGGDLTLAGNVASAVDLDPSPWFEPTQHIAPNAAESYVASYDGGGNLLWHEELYGLYNEIWSLDYDAAGDLYLNGKYWAAADIDPADTAVSVLPVMSEDVFLARWTPDTCRGVFLALDSVDQLGCTVPWGTAACTPHGGQLPYSFLWTTQPTSIDSVVQYNQPGLYFAFVTDAQGCDAGRGFLVNGPTTGGLDMEGHIVAGPFQPGRLQTIFATVHNDGCLPVSDVMRVVLDPQMQFVQALPMQDSIVGDTVYWTFPLMTYDSAAYSVAVTVRLDTTAMPGDSVSLGLVVMPTAGDGNPADNLMLDYRFPIVAAFDPNAITVYPPGQCEERYVAKSAALNYTIHFQNTGNAPAMNVYLRDTLDANLDPSTLDLKASSHPVQVDVVRDSVLVFSFQGIELPDSMSDEVGSHGFVVYDIWPRGTTPNGTVVRNQADIYFDYNPPVPTNTVWNTVVDVVPACPVAVDAGVQEAGLVLYPNPAREVVRMRSVQPLGDVVVVNSLGQVLFRQSLGAALETDLDCSGWARGLYFVRGGGKSGSLLLE